MRRAAFLALFLAACSTYQIVEVQDVDTLYFGTNRPGGTISDAEWRSFVNDVITPVFPGFTEWNASGHWKGSEEGTHVVQIIHPSRHANDEQIIRIISEYKRRYDQEAVLWLCGRGLVAPQ